MLEFKDELGLVAGTRVRIVKQGDVDSCWLNVMDSTVGCTGTIVVSGKSNAFVDLDNCVGSWFYPLDTLEVISTETQRETFEIGDKVRYKDSEIYGCIVELNKTDGVLDNVKVAYDDETFRYIGVDSIVPYKKDENTKDTNPKDAVGIRKVPLSTVSAPVLAEVGVAMLEGARKYGRHNYRVAGVRASVYYDACMRHMMQWWEGEDKDPDSGLSHVTKAIAGLVVLRDAMINDKLVDDRPPKAPNGFIRELEESVNSLFDKYPDAKEAYTCLK